MNKIPSDEDFARADRNDAEQSKHLGTICDNFERHFRELYAFQYVVLMYQRDVDFRAYVFFKTDDELQDARRKALLPKMVEFFYQELERYGRGARPSLVIDVEFDSDENVNRRFQGDYNARLH